MRLAARLPDAHQGAIARQRRDHARTPEAKAALYQRDRRAGRGHGKPGRGRASRAARNLPFAALRVISDDASHVLPPAALVAMKPDGGIALGRVLWSLADESAAAAGADPHRRATSNKAFAELLRCRDLCGVGLAGPDL